MQKLLEKIKDISINDAVKIEESDLQFFALKELYEKLNPPTLSDIPLKKGKQSNDIYLSLVVANSIICYQLSSSWEKYWEEFSKYFGEYKVSKENLIEKLWEFIANSKWNKRFVETKKQRLL